jgi:hypothetical protein
MRIHFLMNVMFLGLVSFTSIATAAERPTLVRTNDPRPDILPRPFYENHTEYRAQYNRPRYIGGWIAYNVSRTSQEAMSWKENYCAGNYDEHHMPPMYKTYYYPKPWEVLQTGARPDLTQTTARPKSTPQAEVIAIPEEGKSSRKGALENQPTTGNSEAAQVDLSPSDR